MVHPSAVPDSDRARSVTGCDGALAAEQIQELIRSGALSGVAPDTARVQPCSLDLTLGTECWRMPASILPLQREPVSALLARCARARLDLTTPQILDRGKVFIAKLAERCVLPSWLGAYTNNKSSVGRIDVQTRTLCDGSPRYDKIPRGYNGDLFLEITPRSFDLELQAGCSLNQAIFYGRRRVLDTTELEGLVAREPLVLDTDGATLPTQDLVIDDGLLLSVDLSRPVVGFVARNTTQPVSVVPGCAGEGALFFEPIARPEHGELLLRRGHFYVFCTREALRIPPEYAVEMLPHESSVGEFRAHYAGFFDPGFGWSPEGRGRGTPAVLEVRPYDDDIILRHGQPICKMAFEHMARVPMRPYGADGVGSHYNDQRGPRLSRFLKQTP